MNIFNKIDFPERTAYIAHHDMKRRQRAVYMLNANWDKLDILAKRERRSVNRVIEYIVEEYFLRTPADDPLVKEAKK